MTKVLLVEDQASIVTVVRYHLESEGLSSVSAADVEEAWRLLSSEAPDAAIVDIKLPGTDGWAFIERIRNDPRFGDLPVVILTGMLEPEVVERAHELECEYLSKPFAASALLMKVRRLLEERGRWDSTQRLAAVADGSSKRIDMVSVGVVMLCGPYQIEGKVHLPPELTRFSEAWESVMNDPRAFIPLTDARITTAGGTQLVASSAFMELRKSDIIGVFPMDIAAD